MYAVYLTQRAALYGPNRAADVKQVTIRAVLSFLMDAVYLTQHAVMHGPTQAAGVKQVTFNVCCISDTACGHAWPTSSS